MIPQDLAMLVVLVGLCSIAWANATIDIGSRLELMVDDYLIERMTGDAELRLHRPTERGLVFVHDTPWEGNRTLYHTIFRDGDLYHCRRAQRAFRLRQ